MRTALQVVLLTLAVAGFAAAGWGDPVPEISLGGGASAVSLLAGVLFVMRSRRKK